MVRRLRKLYAPPVFQGDLNRRGYFEGWYFKHVSRDRSAVLSVIPGISLADDAHAFVQVLDGATGQSHSFRYGLDEFSSDPKHFEIRIGPNRFSGAGIDLRLKDRQHDAEGKLEYRNLTRYPRRLLAPGIMGWYSFVPSMECFHGIVSAHHDVVGAMSFDGRSMDFDGGEGYAEKDWGISFPECWVWMQANSFPDRQTSVMFSVAKIPWRGRFFMGFLCFMFHGGRFYRFMTYNRCRLVSLRESPDGVSAVLRNRTHELHLSASKGGTRGHLWAPKIGAMKRGIREVLDARVFVDLTEKTGEHVFSGESPCGGLEIEGDVFQYFP
jgi:hypothetical protein